MAVELSKLEQFVALALQEDVGDGDHTSLSTIQENVRGEAKLLVKDTGVLAGVTVAVAIIYIVDSILKIYVLLEDGAEVKSGDIAFFVRGILHSIFQAYRLVLYLTPRMS